MRLETPISSPVRYDPLANTSKALEEIGAKLQRQYETWQPRARYKQSLDPTVDEIRKVNRINGALVQPSLGPVVSGWGGSSFSLG